MDEFGDFLVTFAKALILVLAFNATVFVTGCVVLAAGVSFTLAYYIV